MGNGNRVGHHVKYVWNFLLKAIGAGLKRNDIDAIVFDYSVPDGTAEELCEDGYKLLRTLECMGEIDINVPDKLIAVLDSIPRRDLIHFVTDYKERCKSGEEEQDEKKPFKMAARPRGLCFIISNEKFDPLRGKNEKAQEHEELDGMGQPSMNPPSSEQNNSPYMEEQTYEEVQSLEDGFRAQKGANREYQNDENISAKAKVNDNCYDRKGTEVDEDNLERTFTWLGFQVVKKNDCTARQIVTELREIALRNHENYDAFVCCILSHGKEEGIFGTDWQFVSLSEIRNLFKGTACRSLVGKPKLFFFQACRGKDTDKGVVIRTTADVEERSAAMEYDDGPSYKEKHHFDALPSDFEAGNVPKGKETSWDETDAQATDLAADNPMKGNPSRGEKNQPTFQKQAKVTKELVPADNNFLFALPCTPGNKAIIEETQGSWFISKLCEKIQQYACSEDLQSISNFVTNAVAGLTAHGEDVYGKYKAAPEFRFSFGRKLYFYPHCSWEDYCKTVQELAAKAI